MKAKSAKKSNAAPDRCDAVLGVMSGTSLDGVDYALCDASENSIRLRRHWHAAFPARLRQRLRAAAENRSSTYEVGRLHHDLGRFYAEHAAQLGSVKLSCVGLHGQTVFHDATAPATLQLGEAAWLAENLRTPVVSNFRAADLAAGGQGAPLATMFHRWVFAERRRHVCVNNLGGISNVTSLDWRGRKLRIAAFDTGPANMLLDLAVSDLTGGRQTLDRNGKWASQGTARETLVRRWLRDPFFRKKPPKSTGREAFGAPFLARILTQCGDLDRFDLLATLTEFTARSISTNYRLHLPAEPDRVVLCGGGASNPALVAAIRRNIRGEVVTSDTLRWPAQAIEAAAFALLAWLRINNRPGNIPVTTGARRAALLGQICAP